MSKRLNKRQQREAEELRELKLQEKQTLKVEPEDEVEEETDEEGGVANSFAAVS